MQKPQTSPVTSGAISPTAMGPAKETKDVYVLAALILFLAVLLAGFWFYTQSIEQPARRLPAPDSLNNPQVSEALKSVSVPSTSPSKDQTVASVPAATLIHTDIYFEVGRKGLTDEGRAILQQQAERLKKDQDLGILVIGHTDQQGSASYNMTLGLKRAETVKTDLLNAGVAKHQIKTVSLGEEGVLCLDNSDVCRHMNRRVHLEIRTIGQEHMTPPPITLTKPEGQRIEETPITEPVPVIDSPMESAPTPESASSVPSES
jgi:peptidoglycan-associated lipoprotein